MKDKKILSAICWLYLDKPTDGAKIDPKELRGAIAGHYPKETLLHQHDKDGAVKYNYPLVQYKYVNQKCIIIGIEDGAKLISNLNLVGKVLYLSHQRYTIFKKDIELQETFYGIKKMASCYTFLTPWLALNEKNYDKYQRLGTWEKRRALLEKILIGNIISMSKSLGYTVPEPIKVEIHNIKETPTSLKSTPMLGFLGTFSVNFAIPDYWGIGKSVSRGFGTVRKM